VRAEDDAKISMLGVGETLTWKQDGQGLTMPLPDALQDEKARPCQHAWEPRISISNWFNVENTFHGPLAPGYRDSQPNYSLRRRKQRARNVSPPARARASVEGSGTTSIALGLPGGKLS
jgi:hypothetical protein